MVSSMNHHFWGDISAWFIKRVAGIQLNPKGNNINEVTIAPAFIKELDYASAYHIAPGGRVYASWKRDGEKISLSVEIPTGIFASVVLPANYRFENGEGTENIKSGSYTIVCEV